MIDALHATGRYEFVCFGGAVRHENYQPVKIDAYGDDLIIFPVDGYGTHDKVRSLIRSHRPDVLWFMTDPRFYGWLWEIEDEVRPLIPMVYYHVWDNKPYPDFNKKSYESTDVIVSISKVTNDIVKNVSPTTELHHIPHAVNDQTFRKIPKEDLTEFREEYFGKKEKFTVFWNNRNARRKMSGSVIWWFSEFLKKVGKDNARLIMHTDVHDQHGQDLVAIIERLGLTNQEVIFSQQKVEPEILSMLYNVADCTINISDAEGFGLCVDPLSNINTPSGIKKMKDIVIGDEVLSVDGKYHVVENKKETRSTVLEVNSVGNEPIKVSPEHPFFVSSRGDLTPRWKKAEDLVIGDLLAVAKPKYVTDTIEKEIDILDWIDSSKVEYDDQHVWKRMGFSPKKVGYSIADIQKKYGVTKHIAEQSLRHLLGNPNKKYKNPAPYKHVMDLIVNDGLSLNTREQVKINRKIRNNKEFANFIGWYITEGSNSAGNGIELDFHREEEAVAKRCQDVIRNAFGVESYIMMRKEAKTCRLWASSQIVSEFLGNFCGIHSHNKKIPNIYVGAAKSPETMALINGYISGDGHHESEKYSYSTTTTSAILAYQVREVLLANGVFSKIKKYQNTEPSKITGKLSKPQWLIRHGASSYYRLGECTGLETKERDKELRQIMTHILEDEQYFYCPIRDISEGEEMDLMDIQVEGQKSFTANGVLVHNSTLESLSCETPIIVNMTGGLQEQVTDGKEWFGVGIEPASKAVIGSQQVPYIYEDRVSGDDVVSALLKLYEMSPEQREELGRKGREYVMNNFSFELYGKRWIELMDDIHERHGSWETRKGYNRWELEEIKDEN